MATPRRERALAGLRRRIRDLEAGQRKHCPGVLPFGLEPLDGALPEGGLGFGALHEMVPAEPGPTYVDPSPPGVAFYRVE